MKSAKLGTIVRKMIKYLNAFYNHARYLKTLG